MPRDAVPHVVEDFYGVLQLHSDGSVVRGDESVLMPAGPFPDVPGVQWKDAVYDAARGLKVRVYRPPPVTAGGTAEGDNKLPVLVYFHGGGYCVGAYDQPMFHGGHSYNHDQDKQWYENGINANYAKVSEW